MAGQVSQGALPGVPDRFPSRCDGLMGHACGFRTYSTDLGPIPAAAHKSVG
jgi:hypothetical protein